MKLEFAPSIYPRHNLGFQIGYPLLACQALSTVSRQCELIMKMPGDGFRGTLLIFYGEAATLETKSVFIGRTGLSDHLYLDEVEAGTQCPKHHCKGGVRIVLTWKDKMEWFIGGMP